MMDIVINHNISFFDAALSIVEQGQRYAFASVNQAIENSYNWRNLHYFRLFYLSFSDIEILNACVQNLTWTHIRRLEQESSKKSTTSYKS